PTQRTTTREWNKRTGLMCGSWWARAPLEAEPVAELLDALYRKEWSLFGNLFCPAHESIGLEGKNRAKVARDFAPISPPSLHQSGLESANPSADLNKRRLRRPALWLVCSDPRSPLLTLPKLFFPLVSFLIQATRPQGFSSTPVLASVMTNFS